MSTMLATTELERHAGGLRQQLADLWIEDVRLAVPDLLVTTIESADALARLADEHERKVEASQRPGVETAHALHKDLLAELNRLKAPATKLKADAKALGWSCNQELTRRRQVADREAELERQAKQAVADMAAKVETERLRREAEDQRIEAALAFAQSGDMKQAEKLLEQPVEVAVVVPVPVFIPPVAVPEAPKTGTSYGVNWDFEVTDERLIPREYLMVDEVKLRGVVRAMKQNTRILGIRAVEKPTTRLGKR